MIAERENLLATESSTDPTAGELARSAAAVVALNFLYRHGTWCDRRNLQTPRRAAEIETELLRHRRILAENLTLLAAAFDIPELSGAPVFAPDYLEAWRRRTEWGADGFAPQP